MGMKDCFGLDEIAYAKRMKQCSIQQLRIREVKKNRQLVSFSASIGASVAAAIHTVGCSLALGCICGHRLYVATRKLYLVQQEVQSRNLTIYEPRMRDFCIPMAIFTCGACIGFGVHTIVAELVNVAIPVPPTVESAIHSMVEHPVSATVGVTHAFLNVTAVQHAAAVHSTSAAQSCVQLPATVPLSTGGEAGYATDLWSAPSAESAAASGILDGFIDKVEKKK